MRVPKLSPVILPLLVLAMGFLGSKLGAQPLTTPVNVIPDCNVYYDFTTNGSSASFDNRFLGCKTFYVAYTNTGFPALTLTFESAPDNNGVPGAWVAFAGVVLEGVNPNVALTQASTIFYGYYPWVRITLTGAVAGAGRRIRGTFYGYRQVPVSTVIFPPAAAITANQGTANTAANRWPVYLSDGTNPMACNLSAAIELAPAAVGANQIVALTAGQTIHVCEISFANSGAADVGLVQGTGANCAVGTAAVSGTYRNVLSMAVPFLLQPLRLTAGTALCLTSSAGVNIGGIVSYAKY